MSSIILESIASTSKWLSQYLDTASNARGVLAIPTSANVVPRTDLSFHLLFPLVPNSLATELKTLGYSAHAVTCLEAILEKRICSLQAEYRRSYDAMMELLVGHSHWRDFERPLQGTFLKRYTITVKAIQDGIHRQSVEAKDRILGELASKDEEYDADFPPRAGFHPQVTEMLTAVFKDQQHLSTADKVALGRATGLSPRQITVWFANQRQRGLSKIAPTPGKLPLFKKWPPKDAIRKASVASADGWRSRHSSESSLISYEASDGDDDKDDDEDLSFPPLAPLVQAPSLPARKIVSRNYTPSASPAGSPAGQSLTIEVMDAFIGTNEISNAPAFNSSPMSVYSPYSVLTELTPSPILSSTPISPALDTFSASLGPLFAAAENHAHYRSHRPLGPRNSYLNGLDLTVMDLDQNFWDTILEDDFSLSANRSNGRQRETVDMNGGITLSLDTADDDLIMN